MTFKPKFTITNEILNNLTAIAAGREVIKHARLIPQWEIKLRRMALIHSTHASTAIEGNRLNLSQVEALAEGKTVVATSKDKQEVLNYLAALEKIPSLAKKKAFSVDMLLEMHRLVTAKILEKNKCGVFRSVQVFVGRRVFDGTGFKEEVEYMPPDAHEVPLLAREFIGWLNTDDAWKINSVILAGISHYEVARIHPFVDGNGRTARLLATAVLYASGFDPRRFFALDDFYDSDRKGYYAALKTVDKDKRDLTEWLEYFTEGVLFSVNAVKDSIEKIGIKSKAGGDPQIALTPRQMQIIEYIVKNGKATNRDFQALFKISAQAVHKELTKLIEKRIITSIGSGRSLYYVMVDD